MILFKNCIKPSAVKPLWQERKGKYDWEKFEQLKINTINRS